VKSTKQEHNRKVNAQSQPSKQVRNQGSVGGNIMMARALGFASDIAPLLAAAKVKSSLFNFAPIILILT
jgi:xanthine dehydrogenase iron-sulfur cluster and FAD-binding subunit A